MKQLENNLKTATSKLMLFACAIIMTLSLNSCLDDWFKKDKEEEGVEIPGLGNAGGELTGTPFKLPDGVVVEGEITGASYSNDQDNYWTRSFASGVTTRSFIHKDGRVETKPIPVQTRANETTPIFYYRGSGPGYVDLLIPLRNTRSTSVDVTFPAATILVSKAGDCQNGVLLKKVTVTIPANSVYHLCLVFYCGNASKSSAGRYDVYVFGVVSNARALLDLCDRVKNKKINIEEFSRTNSNDRNTYSDQASRLQSIVWNVTDYYGKLDEEDIKYINSLPNSN